jgi:hypothetical protein
VARNILPLAASLLMGVAIALPFVAAIIRCI